MLQTKVGAQTETELKEKKLRVEDALNATKVLYCLWLFLLLCLLTLYLKSSSIRIDNLFQAAVEEGIVVGGGCTLLRLAAKVDAIKQSLDNDEQKVGADIVKRALSYPMKLIAKNAGVNGSVVIEKARNSSGYTLIRLSVLSSDNPKYGYNAATGKYEDLMVAGIIDPTKFMPFSMSRTEDLEPQVVRCCVEHAASVAKTFLTSDAVVVDIKEPEPVAAGNPMDNSGYGYRS
ncbi:hypothetical protein Pint_29687 [Pistacia integerrima]|uniref:Uncharacterized protein n=1 Tax=Pistacia integerrima TaxID=434235 RepID=A0ACC0X3V2_9ROSI|nr:hypothetical protein Pint_29687 [Pistacia integerrima]